MTMTPEEFKSAGESSANSEGISFDEDHNPDDDAAPDYVPDYCEVDDDYLEVDEYADYCDFLHDQYKHGDFAE